MQLKDLREYCKHRKFEIYREFKDIGISGSKKERPELNLLINEAKKKKFDVILVWKFDRFARSTQHLIEALQEFRNLGIDFISYTENIDTSSPMGNAMFVIIGAMAQLERDLIKERVSAGIKNYRSKHKNWGRKKAKFNVYYAKEQLKAGKSLREVAKEMEVSHQTIFNRLKEVKNA